MRSVRFGGAVALLAFILGCGGLQDLVPSGDIKTGAEASRPADFPMPEPPAGTLETSAEMSVAGVATVTVQYTLEPGDNKEILDLYEKSMKDAGLDTVRTEGAGTGTVSGNSSDDKTVWTATIAEDGGKRTLILAVITR